MNILHGYFLLINLFFFAANSSGQGKVSFEASTDVKQVVLNNYFQISFTLRNGEGDDFVPPDFKGVRILSGPNVSQSVQIINNAVSREIGYTFIIQPMQTGRLTIGTASIKVNGKRLKTKPLTIEVLKGNAPSVKSEQQVFAEVAPAKKQAYLGEQIFADYKIYVADGIGYDRYQVAEEAEYKGFYAEALRFRPSEIREVIKGHQYAVIVPYRVALFPQQTGVLAISPATVQAEVYQGNRLFRSDMRVATLVTEPVEVEVKPLPPGEPNTFSGAVGNYEFQASVNRNLLTTDDAFSVTMVISGNGDVKRVQSPPLVLSDSFEVYPPKVIEEKMMESEGQITGRKVLEYLVLPKYPGEYIISPEFSYFDPASEKYITLDGGDFNLTVRQGSDRSPDMGDEKTRAPQAEDIRFIKLKTDLESPGHPFVGSPLFWGLAVLPMFAFIGVFFYRKKQEEEQGLDPTFVKSRSANKEAQKRMANAHLNLKAGSSKAFYDEVSKASLGYVCDKLNIPTSQLTKENLREQLQALQVNPTLIEDFMTVIKNCEIALFAGMDNAAAMNSTYEKAVAVISGIEQGLKK